MIDLFDSLVKAIEARETVALATIVGPGALPPEVLGRKLLLRPDGRLQGSLGAASLDQRVAADCLRAVADPPHARLLSYPLEPAEAGEMGVTAGPQVEVFVEALHPAPTLLVVGAGHIAQPLSQIGKMLGFEVVVVDDRASFANKDRFPEADQVIAGPYAEELARLTIAPSTYVVLVTRGHRQDEEALRQVIGSPAAYVGMIGSRRRVGAVLQRLADDGVPREQIERVCSPIGLDIGAETPEEIAVSILAEVVQYHRRRTRHPSSLSARGIG